ncbi:hypothetical protein [Microbacterium sp.]|uniref:hypothetical protein n=1 Tax=Microbacterium sp. TaxID=51671 RepID=UPI0039E5C98B
MSWPGVDVDDVVEQWRALSAEETTVATKRLPSAEAVLRMRLRLRGVEGTPSFADAENPQELVNEWSTLYVTTVVDVLRGYLVNTEGWLEETERIDDYSTTKRRDAAMSSGRMDVTDAQVDALIPFRRRRRGAFTIALGQS